MAIKITQFSHSSELHSSTATCADSLNMLMLSIPLGQQTQHHHSESPPATWRPEPEWDGQTSSSLSHSQWVTDSGTHGEGNLLFYDPRRSRHHDDVNNIPSRLLLFLSTHSISSSGTTFTLNRLRHRFHIHSFLPHTRRPPRILQSEN